MSDDEYAALFSDDDNINWADLDLIAASHMANGSRDRPARPSQIIHRRSSGSVASSSRARPTGVHRLIQEEDLFAQIDSNGPSLDASFLAQIDRIEQHSQAGNKQRSNDIKTINNSKFFSRPSASSVTGKKRPHAVSEASSAQPSPMKKKAKVDIGDTRTNKEEVREVLKGFEEDLTCPICFDYIVGCHSANPCGHAACGPCSAKWMIGKTKATCFACRASISACNPLIPSLIVDGMIEKHLAALAKNGDKEWDIGGSKRLEWDERKLAWTREQARLKAKAEEDEARRLARLNNLRRGRYYQEEDDEDDDEYTGSDDGSEDEDASSEDDEEGDELDDPLIVDELDALHAAGPVPPQYWVYPQQFALLPPAEMHHHHPVAYMDHVAVPPPRRAPQRHPPVQAPANINPPAPADPAARHRRPQTARRGRFAAHPLPDNGAGRAPAPRNEPAAARNAQPGQRPPQTARRGRARGNGPGGRN